MKHHACSSPELTKKGVEGTPLSAPVGAYHEGVIIDGLDK
jgi:hypothetical protein